MPSTKGKAYRSTLTGDRGFMVVEDGKKYIERDTPLRPVRKPYKAADWIEENEHRPLLPQQVGRIYFEAERAFLIALGEPAGTRMDWGMMNNDERNEWIRGESEYPLVQRLHEAMEAVLKPLSE